MHPEFCSRMSWSRVMVLTDVEVFCGNGILSELIPDVRMEPFRIHDERSMEDWD